jgi:hypothetical protein
MTLIAVVVLAGCGGAGGSSPITSTRSTVDLTAEAAPHTGPLQSHETADLASLLVAVPGYRYVDISPEEQAAAIDAVHETERQMGVDGWFARMSAHGIVADDESLNSARTAEGGRELGFLALTQYSEPIPAGLVGDAAFAASALEVDRDDLDRLDLSGTVVFRAEEPSSRNSRFMYSWVRHGVVGYLDGAVADDLETWLTASLAITPLAAHETVPLLARLAPIEGFVYVDAIGLEEVDAAIVEGLGDVPRTAHQVADLDSPVGTLFLASAQNDDAAALTAAMIRLFSTPGDDVERRIAGITVTEITLEAGLLDLWFDDGVFVMFARGFDGEGGERFLDAYLAATGPG